MAIISNGTTIASGGSLSVSVTPTTSDVLTATAGLSAGAVGTYGQLQRSPANTLRSVGNTDSGSVLRWSAAGGATSGTPSGTWRLLGRIDNNGGGLATSVWIRIS